jgi:hypothetical protein
MCRGSVSRPSILPESFPADYEPCLYRSIVCDKILGSFCIAVPEPKAKRQSAFATDPPHLSDALKADPFHHADDSTSGHGTGGA